MPLLDSAFVKKALYKSVTLTFAKEEQDHSIKKLALIIKKIEKLLPTDLVIYFPFLLTNPCNSD